MTSVCINFDGPREKTIIRCVINADLITSKDLKALFFQVLILVFLSVFPAFNCPNQFVTNSIKDSFHKGASNPSTYIYYIDKRVNEIDFLIKFGLDKKYESFPINANLSFNIMSSTDSIVFSNYTNFDIKLNQYKNTQFSKILSLDAKNIRKFLNASSVSLFVNISVASKQKELKSSHILIRYKNPSFTSFINKVGALFSILDFIAFLMLINKFAKIGFSEMITEQKITLLLLVYSVVDNSFIHSQFFEGNLSFLTDSIVLFSFSEFVLSIFEQKAKYSILQATESKSTSKIKLVIFRFIYICLIASNFVDLRLLMKEYENMIYSIIFSVCYALFFIISRKGANEMDRYVLLIRKYTIFSFIGQLFCISNFILNCVISNLHNSHYFIKNIACFIRFIISNIIALVFALFVYPQIREFDKRALNNIRKPHLDIRFSL